ncbi:hypothetical protein DBT_0226 [Dissulfuribacter thermophilus]|uniref:Uncharacterized protein n=1 Tax=Dissulfuribacter thermophilus TaxID=1156395 RepID=A0A1B9F905_9BACT|nr:hypothetical protein DBT_0226 [Dissulfuribacter thermophilus]
MWPIFFCLYLNPAIDEFAQDARCEGGLFAPFCRAGYRL